MSTRQTLTLHVGSGRCGSTLLQTLLNLPAVHEMFGNFSMKSDLSFYEQSGKLTAGPFRVFEPSHWQDLKENCVQPHLGQNYNNLVLTQENIFGVVHESGEDNVCEESCKLVEFLAEGFDVRIIIVLRRQDSFLESLYNHRLTRREKRTFSDFLNEFPLANLHWADVIDTYKAHFGDANVICVPFEKHVCQSGKHREFHPSVF